MPGLSRIVAAMDGSKLDDDVLAWAGTLALGLHANVTVVNVAGSGKEAEAQAILTAAASRLRDMGVEAETSCVSLDGRGVASALTVAASQSDANLIVLGCRGRTAVGALLLGSVSHAVLAEANLPVLLVRPGRRAGPIRRILLAADRSEGAELATELAGTLALKLGAEIHVLHVPEIGVAPEGVYYVETETEARAVLESASDRLQAKGVKATTHLTAPASEIPRQVVSAIIAEARALDVDLIVTASRGLSDIKGLLLGSVAHTLLHSARRPVLVIHGPRIDAGLEAPLRPRARAGRA